MADHTEELPCLLILDIKLLTSFNNNNNNRRLVTLAEHTSSFDGGYI